MRQKREEEQPNERSDVAVDIVSSTDLAAFIVFAWVNGRAEREAAIALHPVHARALILRVDAEHAGGRNTSVQYAATLQFVLTN
jgi:hypothetical protein